MNPSRNRPYPWTRIIFYAFAGAAVALVVGLLVVALAPENGFADLAAAAVTKVFLIPLGAIVGAAIGWRKRRHSPNGPEEAK